MSHIHLPSTKKSKLKPRPQCTCDFRLHLDLEGRPRYLKSASAPESELKPSLPLFRIPNSNFNLILADKLLVLAKAGKQALRAPKQEKREVPYYYNNGKYNFKEHAVVQQRQPMSRR